jgi:integrase
MTDIDDPGKLRERLSKERDRQERAVRDEENPFIREDIRRINEFLNWRRSVENNKPQSDYLHLQRLRLTVERSGIQLSEIGKSDLVDLINRLSEEYNCKDSYINKYKNTWNLFFSDTEWIDEITLFEIETEKISKEKIFSEEELSDMLERVDPRETAAIAIMADTGCRIGGLCSCYDRTFDEKGVVRVIKFNDKAPTKGAEGNIPLVWADEYLINYRQSAHPCPNTDGVALIHKKRGRFDPDDPTESGALMPKSLRERIQDVMADVGIEKHRRKAHNFRHTAVTRWLRAGISKEVIKYRAQWSDLSMLERYSHLAEDDKDEMTAEEFGLVDPDETEARSTPEQMTKECSICESTVRAGERFCPKCGNPITVEAAHNVPPEDHQEPEQTAEEIEQFSEVLEEMSTAAIIEHALANNPELRESIDLEEV